MDWECCWTKKEISSADCPYIMEGEEMLYGALQQRIMEKCLECPRFKNDMERLKDSGAPLSAILPLIVAEYQEQRARMASMTNFVNRKTREMKFLHELSVVLQTSMDLDEVLSVAMTAITAGKGFGMNRAFLLMADKDRQYLKGYLGVGPRNYEEAWQIWQDIDRTNDSLHGMARNFQKTKLSSEKVKFQDILERLSVPLTDETHILNRALRGKKPLLVEDALHNPDVDPALAAVLGVDCFLVTPLISRKRRIGVIVADNCVTHKPITVQDMQSMETFAFPVAFALERASLHERLREELTKLTAANVKLKEQQELIVKMEKMALVGKITSSIAHSIRNPLMIIGGFARSLLKNSDENDKRRAQIETIVAEAKQLENVLAEVLSYSDSLFPAMDMWDVNQLVSSVYVEMLERLKQRGISSYLDLAADLPMVWIDYKQISYCVRALIINSMEVLTDNGEIRLKTSQERDSVVVEISDTGPAMPKEIRESLTTPFVDTQELGTGTGLPVCRAILERHGNEFIIEDRPGGGTVYKMKLPIKKGESLNE
ncbi:GAF domain-containing sensor histidine kinase [Geotalea toluenoxydans]